MFTELRFSFFFQVPFLQSFKMEQRTFSVGKKRLNFVDSQKLHSLLHGIVLKQLKPHLRGTPVSIFLYSHSISVIFCSITPLFLTRPISCSRDDLTWTRLVVTRLRLFSIPFAIFSTMSRRRISACSTPLLYTSCACHRAWSPGFPSRPATIACKSRHKNKRA